MNSFTQTTICTDLRLTVASLGAFLISAMILIGCLHSPHGMSGSTLFTFWQGPRPNIETGPFQNDLRLALKGASMANKTLIITVLNKAYASDNGMLDLFLGGIHQGENTTSLLNHVLFVSTDQVAYDRCNRLKLHCYKLRTDGVDFSKEVIYMSSDFISMMWKRTWFLSEVLKQGYSFIFTDMDVIWLRDPFPSLRRRQDEDLLFSCDRYNGRPLDLRGNGINTGFYFAASGYRTIALFDEWYAARNASKGVKEQDVLNGMKSGGTFGRLGLKVRLLDTRFFAGFCQNRRGFKEVRTIHANCCRGIKAKLADLRLLLDEWGVYNGTDVPLRWPEKRACSMSWKQKLGKWHLISG